MEKFKARVKRWVYDKIGATDEIRDLRRELAATVLRHEIANRRHEHEESKLNGRIMELESQDGLARMLDTQRNRSQKQAIADLQKEVEHLTQQNKELRRRVDGLL